MEKRDDAELQLARYGVRNTRLEAIRWYSQTAYRFGEYVIKYSLVPSSETQKRLYEEEVKPEDQQNYILSNYLKSFHAAHEAEFLFQVQLLEDVEEQPVEYAGAEWDEKKFPWQTVGKIVMPKQDSFLFSRKAFWEDHLRLGEFYSRNVNYSSAWLCEARISDFVILKGAVEGRLR